MTVPDFLLSLSEYSILLPVITGAIYFKHQDINAKIMLLLVVFALIPQLASSILEVTTYKKIRLLLMNPYTIIDATIWNILFYKNIKSIKIRVAIIIVTLMQFFYWTYLVATDGFQKKLFHELICLTSIVQVIWIVVLLYSRYKTEQILALEKQSLFWFCLGLFIYAPCTYFLFAFYDISRADEFKFLWTIHSILNALMYIVFTIGFFVNSIKYVQKPLFLNGQ